MTTPIALRQVQEWGDQGGLDAVGVTTAEPFERARAVLEERKAAGLHGGMSFTYKNPSRSSDPRRSIPWATSMVVGARSYLQTSPAATGGSPYRGSVARYAWDDPYAALRDGLTGIASALKAAGWKATVIADDNAVVDREAAWRSGIGWFGKNANLLLPGRGSWFVLGSVITNAFIEPAERPVEDGCGSCHRCIEACPTGAIVAPGVVDAGKCLAWIAQAPGVIARQYRVALHDRIYGCDECQEVCPPNLRAAHRAREAAASARPSVDLLRLLEQSDEQLLEQFGRWYIAQREPRWLRRNALVALGNVGRRDDPDVIGALRRFLTHEDPMLRAHAVWAARALGATELLTLVAEDADPLVRAELAG
ncbi:MAG: tRNA epoxyqueuosine(34) reductase QueG [Acidimicrobiia bacterium]|nr:tRNA epoxyqueuosine(34) reductase QueG [Acidimicrobiia bacterium]